MKFKLIWLLLLLIRFETFQNQILQVQNETSKSISLPPIIQNTSIPVTKNQSTTNSTAAFVQNTSIPVTTDQPQPTQPTTTFNSTFTDIQNKSSQVTSSTTPPWEEGFFYIGGVLPYDDADQGCTREAMKMAFDDVNKLDGYIKFVGNVTIGFGNDSRRQPIRMKYKLKPSYTNVGLNISDSLHKLNHLYHNSGSVKAAMLGPPYKEILDEFVEYSTAAGLTHVAYTDADEPLQQFFKFFLQTPPSVYFQFQAAAALLNHFRWKRIGILYDFSDLKYRKNADAVREIVKKYSNISKENNYLTEEGIWSSGVDLQGVGEKMGVFESEDRRIILSLVSVRGARMVFCEAYRRKMYKPKVVWILFEELPVGWAKPGNDVHCTEDELLTAADGHIFIIKQGLRKDGVPSVSGLTAPEFSKRLQAAVGQGVRCSENIGYVYDAVWLLAEGYRHVASKYFLNYTRFYNYGFSWILIYQVHNIAFEGLTGPFKYVSLPGSSATIYKRMGQINYWTYNKKNQERVYVGTHHTAMDKLETVPKVENILFDSAEVPKDKGQVSYKFSHFEKSLLIVMWLVAFVGVVIAAVLLSVTLLLNSETGIGSPMLNSTIILGSILCYTSVVVYGLDTRLLDQEHIPNVCYIFTCTLSIGFTMTFGGLFAKTWGFYKTYFTQDVNSQTEIKYLPEWVLMLMVGFFLLIDVIILVTWNIVAPFRTLIQDLGSTENLFADDIKIDQIVRCDCENFTQFFTGLCCYKGILLVFGIFLAWQTKHAKVRGGTNEVNQVALAIYNVFAVSIIGVICVSVLMFNTNYIALYAIVAICIFICTTFTLLIMFVPKIKAMVFKETEDVKHTRTGSTKKAELYVRRTQYEEASTSREMSKISTTVSADSTTTMNTQVESGNISATSTKNNIAATLSAASVVTCPPGFMETSPDSSSIDNDGDLPAESENQFSSDRGNDKVEITHCDSGLGEDSPHIGKVILNQNEENGDGGDIDDTIKNETPLRTVRFENDVLDVTDNVNDDDKLSPMSTYELLTDAN